MTTTTTRRPVTRWHRLALLAAITAVYLVGGFAIAQLSPPQAVIFALNVGAMLLLVTWAVIAVAGLIRFVLWLTR